MKIETLPRQLNDTTITLTPTEFAVIFALVGQCAGNVKAVQHIYDQMRQHYTASTGADGDSEAALAAIVNAEFRMTGSNLGMWKKS